MLPRKADIDPSAIPKLLPGLVIYERVERSHFRIRLMGTDVVSRIGRDFTGANVLDLTNYAQRDRLGALLNRLLDERLCHHSIVVDRFLSGREARVEIVRLPLLDASGDPRFLITCTEELQTVRYRDADDQPVLIAEPIVSTVFDGLANGRPLDAASSL